MIQKIRFSFVFSKRDLISLDTIIPTNPIFFYIDKYTTIFIYTYKKTKHCITHFCFSMGANKNDSPRKTFLTKILIKKAPWITLQYGGYVERRRAKISFIFRKRIIKVAEYFITKVKERSC